VTAWLLDTNVVSELGSGRPEPAVAAWAADCVPGHLCISVLTLGEYGRGIVNLAPGDPMRARLLTAVRAIELRFADRVLPVTDAIVRRWGSISGDVRRRTRRSPHVVDMVLAATAIEHDLTLVTRNVKDVAATGAKVLNPWTWQGKG
jgi:predicted nucleic acid-binding protein